MALDNDITAQAMERVRERQVRIGRILAKRGITLKAIHHDSGIPYNTLRSYFSQERNAVVSVIPVWALNLLFGVIDDDLLSILTEPEGRCFHGTTQLEREAEANLIAISDAAEKALCAMRGTATGQEEMFGGDA